ncbi:protein transporter Sec31 [Streptomyces sp. NPDC006798]|uniref:protein transporter Sec31 n=1 Tax=unclassified Streptomyces TaxID=2593676 RepID=UPI003321153E
MATPHHTGAGLRTRAVTRTRTVPHTIDGRTVLVTEPYTEEVPVPPRDWDRIVLGAVTLAAGLLVTASVIWSTASIGDLLARVVTPPAAYSAAAVFDLLWIMCMALEWLARYDAQRATLPRRAGHAALAIAMAAVAAHGWLADQIVIGIIGAAVSGIAKTGWTIVLAHYATPLDPKTQQWVDIQRGEIGGRLAMVAVRRELARGESLVAAEAAALAQPGPDTQNTVPDTLPDSPDTSPDTTVRPIRPSAREAVRTALASGITDPDAVLRYVRTTADPQVSSETVSRYIRALRRTA